MDEREAVVYRQLAIPVSVFDRIKAVQRRHEARQGERLTIMGSVALIVREHLRNEEREEHEREQQQGTSRAR